MFREARRYAFGGAVTVLVALAGRVPAGDGDGVSRREELIALLAALDDGTPPAPSVLGDVDLRTAQPEVRRIARTLRETLLDVRFEKRPVREVLDFFHQVSNLNFVVSAKARKALEESKRTVDLSLRKLPLENVLNLLALHLGGLRFTLRYNAVLLITDEEYRPRRVTVIYDVTDLVQERPDFPAPPLALSTPGEEKK